MSESRDAREPLGADSEVSGSENPLGGSRSNLGRCTAEVTEPPNYFHGHRCPNAAKTTPTIKPNEWPVCGVHARTRGFWPYNGTRPLRKESIDTSHP